MNLSCVSWILKLRILWEYRMLGMVAVGPASWDMSIQDTPDTSGGWRGIVSSGNAKEVVLLARSPLDQHFHSYPCAGSNLTNLIASKLLFCTTALILVEQKPTKIPHLGTRYPFITFTLPRCLEIFFQCCFVGPISLRLGVLTFSSCRRLATYPTFQALLVGMQ